MFHLVFALSDLCICAPPVSCCGGVHRVFCPLTSSWVLSRVLRERSAAIEERTAWYQHSYSLYTLHSQSPYVGYVLPLEILASFFTPFYPASALHIVATLVFTLQVPEWYWPLLLPTQEPNLCFCFFFLSLSFSTPLALSFVSSFFQKSN